MGSRISGSGISRAAVLAVSASLALFTGLTAHAAALSANGPAYAGARPVRYTLAARTSVGAARRATEAAQTAQTAQTAQAASARRGATPPHLAAPFGPAFIRFVATRQSIVGAAVYDAVNGQLYTYHPTLRFDTASIVKVSIMGTLFYDEQKNGRTLDGESLELLTPMIEDSSNSAATALWNTAGRSQGIEGFLRAAGLTDTSAGRDGYWGLTLTTAPNQANLIKDFAYPNRLLDAAHRASGLSLMEHVINWEGWGVSAGPGASATVALKNGWLPLSAGNWEINSIGWVKGDGRNYTIAVLTRNNPSEAYGISTVQGISRIVWNSLGDM